MKVSANFAFLGQRFHDVAESASLAEHHVYRDPRASCFHARHALERLVIRVYRLDRGLSPPPRTNLYEYVHQPAFRELVPEKVWQKIDYIRNAGNTAVHGKKTPPPKFALNLIRELSHILYWTGRTYLKDGPALLEGKTLDESLIPEVDSGVSPASIKELEALQTRLDAEADARSETEKELEQLREQLAAIRAENEDVPDTHDWNEDKTRKLIIDLDLYRAGWPLNQLRDREYELTGMPSQSGVGFADYVLWGDNGKPLAVVEAKKTTVDPEVGQQQAKLYADCLEAMHVQRPVIFFTNGYKTKIWDDLLYPPREVAGFYKKDELETLIRRRTSRQSIVATPLNKRIVERHYAHRAIASIGQHFESGNRKALLVMATGTGKTRISIALVDVLQRAQWAKRILFLADRISLVRQACNAFKEHLPASSPVNLVTEKDKTGRVYVSTYPTMMGLINETRGNEARFGVGHFDLVIIDEAHRSVYQKYGAIFEYFDSLLVGLTATPRDQVDRNTYSLFGLRPGVPTDAYELETAVRDGFLVPPRVQQVDLKFPRQGIDYDSLSDEEKEQWESLDWGDEVEPGKMPKQVNAAAINSWLFNKDTVDKVLQHLMEHGHKVNGGDSLAKTILFARNHEHAKFIEKQFNHHYPHYRGHFARIIDHYAKYPQSLLDDFSIKDKEPHIAISVDMLDTGIDVPEVANLVFFKPVYSKIKFWQMIGRGTRLCPDLFGPGQDKEDFRVFDFCFNFDFFKEHPEGIEGSTGTPLGTRLFQSRTDLLMCIQEFPDLDPESELASSLRNELLSEVTQMNRDNFIVRMHLEAVNKYRESNAWESLTESDQQTLKREVAGLPSETELDDIESRLFDLKALNMQLALATGDEASYETLRKGMVDLAILLEEKRAIPAVQPQLAYLASMQEQGFWEGVNLNALEDMRLRLRRLVPLLDKKDRHIVYTDFEDEITGVSTPDVVHMPTMTSAQYEKKVKEYLNNHLDHLVILKLRKNEPLTVKDLEGLEQTLAEIGDSDGQELLIDLLARSDSPSLAHFIRKMVGLDRVAAQAAFSDYLNDRSLTPQQIRFVEMVIDQLTARGVMDASALYESPFSDLHSGGPEKLFSDRKNVIEGIFEKLEKLAPEVDQQSA